MSHTTAREPSNAAEQITDLDALAAAAGRVGMVFKANQKQYQHYTSKRPCDHALVPGPTLDGIRQGIGVLNSRQYPGTYKLEGDISMGLDRHVGYDYDKLTMYYQIEAAKRLSASKGHIMLGEVELPGGDIVVEIEVPEGAAMLGAPVVS